MPFHFNSSTLDIGSVILPGNFGRILRIVGPSHPLFEREQRLERVRSAQFPQLPSRLESAFFFTREVDARHFAEIDPQWTLCNLYEVELTCPSAPQHCGAYNILTKNPSDEWIEGYWKGSLPPEPSEWPVTIEHLGITGLRVISRL